MFCFRTAMVKKTPRCRIRRTATWTLMMRIRAYFLYYIIIWNIYTPTLSKYWPIMQDSTFFRLKLHTSVLRFYPKRSVLYLSFMFLIFSHFIFLFPFQMSFKKKLHFHFILYCLIGFPGESQTCFVHFCL